MIEIALMYSSNWFGLVNLGKFMLLFYNRKFMMLVFSEGMQYFLKGQGFEANNTLKMPYTNG